MKPFPALVLVLCVVISVTLLSSSSAIPPPNPKTIFLAQKCNMCHSLQAQGIERTSKSETTKGPDLGGLAKKRDAAWLKKWLKREEMINGKKHSLPFKGTPQDMDTIIAWLLKQEAPPAGG